MDKPLIVQTNRSILLQTHSPMAEECRKDIINFAQLVKCPEHIHTFEITALSLFNACSLGITKEFVLDTLNKYSIYGIPETLEYYIDDVMNRYNAIYLKEYDKDHYVLYVAKNKFLPIVASIVSNTSYLEQVGESSFILEKKYRGQVKLKLIERELPIIDTIKLRTGDPLSLNLRDTTLSGQKFEVRNYQAQSTKYFLENALGHGVIVLPCGAGKTIVGLDVINKLQTKTLILTPNVTSVKQWKRELLDKTSLTEEDVGEYTTDCKVIKNITISTYQMMIYRNKKTQRFDTLDIFLKENWGLVIYDEVHLLPAPVFQFTCELQSIHRLGLTATLVREDGKEKDVFSLVGPKVFDIAWQILESDGFIAKAYCHEVRVELDESKNVDYLIASKKEQFKIASKNSKKNDVIKRLLKKHEGEQILIIGIYLDQLKELKEELDVPLITGSTKNSAREELYHKFKTGEVKILLVSKVANFAVDLPDASVAIEVSGTYGSRAEEAQRLGRILRPKKIDSNFYTLVTKYSQEEAYSFNRQKFLIEQGYTYTIENENE